MADEDIGQSVLGSQAPAASPSDSPDLQSQPGADQFNQHILLTAQAASRLAQTLTAILFS